MVHQIPNYKIYIEKHGAEHCLWNLKWTRHAGICLDDFQVANWEVTGLGASHGCSLRFRNDSELSVTGQSGIENGVIGGNVVFLCCLLSPAD